MLDKIKNFFSGNTSFGLQITDTAIRIAQVSEKDGAFTLTKCAERKLELGIVVDGEILKEKELSQQINSLFQEQKVDSKTCAVAIPEKQSFEHIFYIPSKIKGDEFAAYLDKLVAETIPLSFHSIKYDYSVVNLGQIQVVSVVAARREIIAQYYETLHQFSKIETLSLEPTYFSIMRNIAQQFPKDQGTILIDINEEKITWYAIWGANIFDMHTLDKADFNTNPSAINKELEKVSQEFAKITKLQITQIHLSGSPQNSAGLQKHLQKTIKLPISIIEKYKVEPPENGNHYKVAIGLALRGKGINNDSTINLLKK
ncbi:pilus assembly protein PilM [Candidatus Gracilibacteria bacterium]|nr:pilus assembly protein PilM [Candidatus Gracilibacteria bacterium]